MIPDTNDIELQNCSTCRNLNLIILKDHIYLNSPDILCSLYMMQRLDLNIKIHTNLLILQGYQK